MVLVYTILKEINLWHLIFAVPANLQQPRKLCALKIWHYTVLHIIREQLSTEIHMYLVCETDMHSLILCNMFTYK